MASDYHGSPKAELWEPMGAYWRRFVWLDGARLIHSAPFLRKHKVFRSGRPERFECRQSKFGHFPRSFRKTGYPSLDLVPMNITPHDS
jgi:hypothetical protein